MIAAGNNIKTKAVMSAEAKEKADAIFKAELKNRGLEPKENCKHCGGGGNSGYVNKFKNVTLEVPVVIGCGCLHKTSEKIAEENAANQPGPRKNSILETLLFRLLGIRTKK